MRFPRTAALIVAGLLIAGSVSTTPASAGVSFDFFYSNLSPHGHWYASGSYGRVWQPAVYRAGWNPYYDGHWAYTDVGWCWDSDYDWGGIPYHYGTWVWDDSYGWVWAPGYVWAPSWVVFRTGPDYIGWAPVEPSFSIGVSFGSHSYASDRFVFLRSRDFLCDHVRSYALQPTRSRFVINNTTIVRNNIRVVNNVVVNRGPDISFVERATRRRVDRIPVERVRSVRAMPSFSREQIRVDRQVGRRGLRVAERVPASAQVPERRGRERERMAARPEARDFDRAAGERRRERERMTARPEARDFDRAAGEGRRERARIEPRMGRERTEGSPSAAGRENRDDLDRTSRPRERRSWQETGSQRERPAPERGRDRIGRRDARPDEGQIFRGVRDRKTRPDAAPMERRRERAKASRGDTERSREREKRPRRDHAHD